jgi:anti-anti-sigma factor
MVPVVDRELRAAELAAPVVVLDLRSLEFVDSSGATLILSTARRMGRAGRRLVLARCSFEVRWLLALMGVDRELEFADAESLVHQQSDGGRHERRRACR